MLVLLLKHVSRRLGSECVMLAVTFLAIHPSIPAAANIAAQHRCVVADTSTEPRRPGSLAPRTQVAYCFGATILIEGRLLA